MPSRKTNNALDIIARAARAKTNRKGRAKSRGKKNPPHDAVYYRRQIADYLKAYRKGEISAETYISNANHLQAKLERLTKKPANKASKRRAKKTTSRRRR